MSGATGSSARKRPRSLSTDDVSLRAMGCSKCQLHGLFGALRQGKDVVVDQFLQLCLGEGTHDAQQGAQQQQACQAARVQHTHELDVRCITVRICLFRALPPPPTPPPPLLLRLRAPSWCALLRQSVLKVLATLCPLRFELSSIKRGGDFAHIPA